MKPDQIKRRLAEILADPDDANPAEVLRLRGEWTRSQQARDVADMGVPEPTEDERWAALLRMRRGTGMSQRID